MTRWLLRLFGWEPKRYSASGRTPRCSDPRCNCQPGPWAAGARMSAELDLLEAGRRHGKPLASLKAVLSVDA